MGHAAYQRGTATLRRGLDEQAKRASRRADAAGVPLSWEDERAELRASVATARRELERATLRLRVLAATLTAERVQRAEESRRLLRRAHDAGHAMLCYRRRWEWVSRIVRRFVAPEQVAQFRGAP